MGLRYEFKLSEWQRAPRWWTGFWLHVYPPSEDEPMEVVIGLGLWQLRGYCYFTGG